MEGKLIAETKRLFLREHTVHDAQVLYDLNNDPEVMKYVGEPGFESVENTRKAILAYDHYQKHNMGRWGVSLKSSGEYLGWCGLKLLDEGYVDLGYRFMKKTWGKGYATESSIACLKYGFEVLQLEEIVAHSMIENKASERVMQKVGMRYTEHGKCDGFDVVIYKADRTWKPPE